MRILTTFVVLVLAVVIGGCKSNSTSSRHGANVNLTDYDPDAMTVEGWLNPKTLQIHASTVRPEDGDMVIRGAIRGWNFIPAGDIEGSLHPVPSKATPDRCWLMLRNRTIVYADDGASPPEVPHLQGSFDVQSGLFYPSSSVVHGR